MVRFSFKDGGHFRTERQKVKAEDPRDAIRIVKDVCRQMTGKRAIIEEVKAI